MERPLIWEQCPTWSVCFWAWSPHWHGREINLHVSGLVCLHRTENRKRPWSSGPWQALMHQSCPPPARRGRLLLREVRVRVRVRTVGKQPSPQAWGCLRGLQAWSLPAAPALRKTRMRSSTSERYSSAKGQAPRTLHPEQLTAAGLWLCLGTAPSSTPLGLEPEAHDTRPGEVRDPNELPLEFLSALSLPPLPPPPTGHRGLCIQ